MTLAVAEERLARCNRDVRAAEHALDAAQADRIVAGQRPNPTLTLGAASINPQLGIGAGSLRDKTLDSSVRLEQLIERGGKGELRERQADALVAAARADLADTARSQRLAMRQAFFDLAALAERVRVQREFIDLADASAKASERRFASGDVARVDADRIRLDALRTANDLRQAEIDFERGRLELAKLLGAESSAATLDVRTDWSEAIAPRAGGERPDVAAARLRLQAAESARDLARSIATRDVTLGVQADRYPVSETNLQGFPGMAYSVSVSIPLHVRHANEGEARRAIADLEAARSTLARVEAQAAAEARLAESDWKAAAERRRRVEEDVLPVARAVAERSEYAYSRGATGVLELLDARRTLKAAELDAMQARAEAAKAWARRAAAFETISPP